MARLDKQHSISDLRALARRRLPRPIFDYLDGGAETESTLARNTAAFEDARLAPRCLVDVTAVNTSARMLGGEAAFPLICSPTGASRFYHPEGERAVARAAARAGVFYGVSTMSTTSLEDVATTAPGLRFFQIYVFNDEGVTRELVARCRAASYDALCLTVDAAVRGKRERELRSGMGAPLRLTPGSMASFALRPFWLGRQAMRGSLSMPNLAQHAGGTSLAAQTAFIGRQLSPSITWREAERLAKSWGGPFAIKGVMSAEDARLALDAGASAIFVSNHGGRQLDGAAAPFDVLPEIAAAVGGRADIILDGGVRRGVHILKALASGATACAIGRPYLYGLAAGGEAGVARALEILRSEFVRAMQLCGCTGLDRITPDLLRVSNRERFASLESRPTP